MIEPTGLNAFFSELAITVLSVVLSLLAGFLTMGVRSLAKKWKINMTATQEAWTDHQIQKLILALEEEGAQRIKAGLPKLASGDKFESAVEGALAKIPGISPEEAEALVLSNLPKVGAGAIAALQRIREAARSAEAVQPQPPVK